MASQASRGPDDKMPPPQEPQSGPAETTAEHHPIQESRGQEGMDRGRDRRGRKDKGRDLARKEWSRTKIDKRGRNDAQQASKRRKVEDGTTDLPIYATQFSKEDIEAEERRPKKKVAVLIGYSGSGYKGMQLTPKEKTIEGDLFSAFVAAGAISKANADDPKKSSLVRCARTDKGVHAAGNVVSLKLIVEDPEVVQKINANLVPQIRVWGIELTNKSFSCYQLCDSRIYEYLIPTHCFLPPHPSSYLGKMVMDLAKEAGEVDAYQARQEEVASFWEEIENIHITPILETLDEETRTIVERALYDPEKSSMTNTIGEGKQEGAPESSPTIPDAEKRVTEALESTEQQEEYNHGTESGLGPLSEPSQSQSQPSEIKTQSPIGGILKSLRAAYLTAKRSYRIPPERLDRVRDALNLYLGTRNFHNYTIHKPFSDPSGKRVIKSFNFSPEPILINGTEWLSLKVHGQSFMMHQIRKMVGMVVLVVRCGCDPIRITESYGREKMSIPKAPGLGLLLERPIFDSYNKRAQIDYGKEKIDFDKYKMEIEQFKQKEIYERMFQDEERENIFGNFFNHLDNFHDEAFLWVTAMGIAASKSTSKGVDAKTAEESLAAQAIDSEPEDEFVNAEEGEG